MKIGLYFGTYNPIHKGHLVIANYMIQHAKLDRIWMVVSPQNPLKIKDSMLSDFQRLELVKIALKSEDKRIEASNIEFDLPKPSYTWQSLQFIQKKYPNDTFVLIMGEDNLRQFERWKDHVHISDNFKIYVYPRISTESELEHVQTKKYFNHKNVQLFNVPVINISSSEIRGKLAKGEQVDGFLNQDVLKKIKEKNYFSETTSNS